MDWILFWHELGKEPHVTVTIRHKAKNETEFNFWADFFGYKIQKPKERLKKCNSKFRKQINEPFSSEKPGAVKPLWRNICYGITKTLSSLTRKGK